MENLLFLLLLIGIPVMSQFVSTQLRTHFARYSSDPMPLSGREAAERMLQSYNIRDVQVISTQGQLTDHYDPASKTVNLSQVVFNAYNVAAIAVATHECGHALQDADDYPLMSVRSSLIPLMKLSNVAIPLLAFGGAGISQLLGNHGTALLCLAGFGVPALFSLVTLPVEFNASHRALQWLQESGMRDVNYKRARKALFWAAMTYVIGALGAIAQAFYFAWLFLGRRSRG
jgi:Zn-dependent membrane protease YugP